MSTHLAQRGIDIGPHPHIGLQTVTWLFDGEILHRDRLGSEQLIRPRQLILQDEARPAARDAAPRRGWPLSRRER